MSKVFNMLLNLFEDIFSLMEQFTFMGTNLLQFSVGLLVIGVMLPVVLALGKSVLVGTNGAYKNGKSNSKAR